MATFPTPKVHRPSRRRLTRGSFPITFQKIPAGFITVTEISLSRGVSFSSPVNGSGGLDTQIFTNTSLTGGPVLAAATNKAVLPITAWFNNTPPIGSAWACAALKASPPATATAVDASLQWLPSNGLIKA